MRITPPALPLTDALPELVFQWERRSRVHWRLVSIVAWSLLSHAVSFYVLQVAYTPTGSQLPPPAQVVMVPLDQPGNDAFARWLAMADPSLIIQPTGPTQEETLASVAFPYAPSYKVVRSGFKSLEALAGDNALAAPPRPRLPGPVPIISKAATTKSLPSTGWQTVVTLSGDLKILAPIPLPLVEFKALKVSEPLEPTVFLVGVRSEGGIPFVFQQSNSGNALVEEFARDYLTRLDFRLTEHAEETVAWGWATFAWGTDIYLPTDDRKTNP